MKVQKFALKPALYITTWQKDAIDGLNGMSVLAVLVIIAIVLFTLHKIV